jgi:hypothetical protein
MHWGTQEAQRNSARDTKLIDGTHHIRSLGSVFHATLLTNG